MKKTGGRTFWMGILMAGMLAGQGAFGADLDWKLKKSRNGINAYTAKMANNDHMAFKGETLLKGKTLDQAIAVLRDVPHMDQWLHTCYEPKLVQDENPATRIIYMKNNTPTFLVAERDLVIRQVVERTSPTTAVITLTGVPDLYPRQDGFVRVPFFDGKWEFEQNADGVRAIYTGMIDPGGSMPTSITNMLVVDTPFETMKKLAAYMGK